MTVFGITGGDAPPAFQMQEGILDAMAAFVKRWAVPSLVFSAALWRDHGSHPLRLGLAQEGIRIVPLIGDQMTGLDPFDQAACQGAIRAGTFRNQDSERQTSRIHGQMHLGVEPPWVRSMAWLPPRAPAAWT